MPGCGHPIGTEGRVAAITTAPLHKTALNRAGYHYQATPSCWPNYVGSTILP